jgi:CheY-like chemotaxis protein
VLVVEDNDFSQKLIEEYLSILGIDIKIAEHGQEALSLLEQYDFDAVLMDIHMPIMNGIEATQQIRQQAKFATLPIIALSAGVTEVERNNCIACGMVGFISKPINVEKLYKVLKLWLKPISEF